MRLHSNAPETGLHITSASRRPISNQVRKVDAKEAESLWHLHAAKRRLIINESLCTSAILESS